MKSRLLLLVSVALGGLALQAGAADWPQWRGPQRNGISPETGLLKDWPKDGPHLLWQLNDIGYGYSSPAVVGDRLFLLGTKQLDAKNVDMDNEYVLALAADGKQVWSTRLGKVGPNDMANFATARSTPTVDGELLYALGSDGDLACLETVTGKVRWQKNLRSDFGGQPGEWAYAESPLIEGDTLVCTPGGTDATLVALNKKTGAVIWKSAVPGGDKAGYASVTVAETSGRKQYVQFLAKGVVGVDAKTGQFLWRYDQTGKSQSPNIPTPVAHDSYVYSSGSGFGGLVRLKAEGSSVRAEQVYYERGLPSNIGGAVLVGDHLYGTSGQGMNGTLVCVEYATGKVKWRHPCVGSGAVCAADGGLYVHGENGQVALVEVTPEEYREKGRFTPPSQPQHIRGGMERAWVYPVVANGKLYIRDGGSLWCYDVRGGKATP